MAGIGFVLRKLAARGDLLGLVQGYAHASVSTSGGWLFTIVTLSVITFFGPSFAAYEDLAAFRLIVVYNFAFSLVLTGPITMVLTRYLSDQIFARTVEGVPGMVVGGLTLAVGVSAPIVVPFYFWYANLTPGARLAAWVGYALVAGIWVLSVFLSTLKEYAAVTRSFGIGMLIALTAASLAGPDAGVGGMLAGFDVGLAYIVFALVGRVFAEFPFPVVRPFAFLPHVRTHWDLALAGGVYYAGVWVDKWLMWVAPERIVQPSRLVSYPDYDSALFLACLTIVPSMAVFVVNIETQFFDKYHHFYRDIGAHATLARLRDDQTALLHSVFRGSRQLLVPQIVLVVALVVLAPVIFTLLRIPYGQLAIFRIATIGALFQLLFLLLTIVLSYLDLNRLVLGLHVLFFAVNTVATLVTLELGFPYYGYGYFAASVVAFVTASVVTLRCLDELPYHAFITGNASVR
ncbi:MAG: exopolysaccharide Pel transporter PelG [Vicinamibacterales bacterium]